MLGMLVSEKDAPHHVVALPHHPDLLRGLNEINRLERIEQLTRNAARIAPGLGRERYRDLALQRRIVGRQHLCGGPWLEDRILGISDALGRLGAGSRRFCVAGEWMGRVRLDRTMTVPRRRISPIRHIGLPAERSRSELGNTLAWFRPCRRGERGRG